MRKLQTRGRISAALGILLSVAALGLIASLPAEAQNIDIDDYSGVFTASGISENYDSEEATAAMNSSAENICRALGPVRQLSPTRYRTTYGLRIASAEFDCLDQAHTEDRSTNNVSPGMTRRCWYFDDSNPACLNRTRGETMRLGPLATEFLSLYKSDEQSNADLDQFKSKIVGKTYRENDQDLSLTLTFGLRSRLDFHNPLAGDSEGFYIYEIQLPQSINVYLVDNQNSNVSFVQRLMVSPDFQQIVAGETTLYLDLSEESSFHQTGHASSWANAPSRLASYTDLFVNAARQATQKAGDRCESAQAVLLSTWAREDHEEDHSEFMPPFWSRSVQVTGKFACLQ